MMQNLEGPSGPHIEPLKPKKEQPPVTKPTPDTPPAKKRPHNPDKSQSIQ